MAFPGLDFETWESTNPMRAKNESRRTAAPILFSSTGRLALARIFSATSWGRCVVIHLHAIAALPCVIEVRRAVGQHLGHRHLRVDHRCSAFRLHAGQRPRRPLRSPMSAPANSSGASISTFMTGSSRHGLADSIASESQPAGHFERHFRSSPRRDNCRRTQPL